MHYGVVYLSNLQFPKYRERHDVNTLTKIVVAKKKKFQTVQRLCNMFSALGDAKIENFIWNTQL